MKIKKSAFYIFMVIFSLHSSAFAEPSVADIQYRAEQGQPVAQYHLGMMLLSGEQGVVKNYEQAFKWLTAADQNGSVGAKYSLGMMYYTGMGVEKDAKRAFDYFTKAAAKGHAKAQYNLGVLYDKGEGTAQDYRQAFEWFNRAAEQGYPHRRI